MLQTKCRCIYALDTIRIPYKYSHKPTILIVFLYLLLGLLPLTQTFLLAVLINNIPNVNTGVIALLVINVVLIWMLPTVIKYSENMLKISIYEKAKRDLAVKKSKLSYTDIENPTISDMAGMLNRDTEVDLLKGLKSVGGLISLFSFIIGLLILIATFSIVPVLALLAISMPLSIIAVKASRATYNARKDVANLERERDMIGDILTKKAAAGERILFGFGERLLSIWEEKFNLVYKTQRYAYARWFSKVQAGAMVFSCLLIIVVLILSQLLHSNLLTIGLFVSLVSSFLQLVERMSWDFSDLLDGFVNSTEYLADFDKYMNLTENDQNNTASTGIIKQGGLEIRNLSFTYPGNSVPTLKNINLLFEPNKKYALVGENGSGKSTLIKLIMGLYQKYEGDILLGETNVKSLTQNERNSNITAVFQDFAHFSLPFRDYLNLGKEIPSADADIIDMAKKLSLSNFLERIDNDLKRPLGKIFHGGVELSGGEWQRICILNARLRNAGIIILDEPTSALDPLMEASIYRDFTQGCEGKTMISISHRLGSVRGADQIFVLSSGEITEQGTHEELMRLRGLYFRMYSEQKKWYLIDEGGIQ